VRRDIFASGVVLACALAWCSSAFALNTALEVSQYTHASWTRRDGFTTGIINAITQTADGYLWLGTDFGLLRFDGVRAVPWQPPAGQRLPANEIRSLLVARDGSLWIGTSQGLSRWNGHALTHYSQVANQFVVRLLEDHEGVVWVSTLATPSGRLCAVQASDVRCDGDDGRFGYGIWELYEDGQRNLWAAVTDGLWRLKPGPPDFVPVPGASDTLRAFHEHQGVLQVGTASGVRELRDGKLRPSPLLPATPSFRTQRFLRDRDGGLWIGTQDRGVVHVHDGRSESFSRTNGLSSDNVVGLFEDREGSIWLATQNGLDRFTDPSVSIVGTGQNLAGAAYTVLAEGNETLWITSNRGLHRWRRSQATLAPSHPTMSGRVFGALFRSASGRLWSSTLDGPGYVENDRFIQLRAPKGIVREFAQQGDTLWAISQHAGLLQLDEKGVVRQIAWSSFARNDFATALTPDAAGTGLWVGFLEGGITYFDGDVRTSYTPKDGLGEGRVNELHVDEDGVLWVATQGGLSRFENGRFRTLAQTNGLPCDGVHWTTRDDQHALWLYMPCGLARIPRDDLQAWIGASGHGPTPARLENVTVLDTSDGVAPELLPTGFRPAVAKTGDGRLWFSGIDGVHVVAPRHLPFNPLPPPVFVERVIANQRAYDLAPTTTNAVQLPALVRDLQIDYTALSLVAPSKMRFRYKLEGWDREWQDVGTRRQAFYTSLPPRSYRFRVIASNNSGVWNETGATLEFAIPPAYYQTVWFPVLVVGTVLAGIWAAHRVRLRIVEKHEREIIALNERLMKAQEQERIRIAGELHDGVMQEMLAVTMMLGSAKRRIPSELDARATIDKVQDKLIKVGTDIRQLSHDLHPPILQEAGLPEAVRAYCEQFTEGSGIPVSCDADDSARDLSRGAALALFRIIQEALGNAAKHAHATQTAVRLTRATNVVTVEVSDNGAGFDPNELRSSRGLGLVMMRERAGQLNGKFEFESAPGRGTTIRVVIPFR
jgi:signal transduction histidine kinase/ligand-binding sensor domain-containing protein